MEIGKENNDGGFEDALNDETSRNNKTIQRSSVILTDTSNMTKKKTTKLRFEERMIKYFFHVRGYSEKIDSDNKNFVYFTNGKSNIRININFNCIFCGYKFDEYFENTSVISKGSFPSDVTGFNASEEYYKKRDYKGSECFRQAFLCEDKLVTISLILKRTGAVPGWCCLSPKFSMYIEVSYFDINNNESLRGLNTEAILETISTTKSYLAKEAIPDYTETISVVDEVIGEKLPDCDDLFLRTKAHLYQSEIQDGLSKAFKKVEHYLGTKLEKKEKLRFTKRLIPQRNTKNK